MKRTLALLVAVAMMLAVLPTYADASSLNEALNVEGGAFEFVSEGTNPWIVEGDHAKSGNPHMGGTTSTVILLWTSRNRL